ncbi:hemolysin III [Saccharospirillum sp. MSK14-1]|uniref:PAQR family membrane homeostasis protein TrhA n=1 Tax=Saccharospirillum sp. MSK14-1 TaxID=1897632 RepID=UPI000D397422|nr:hemolysin III family protein [Saccharospirillum sp. MSK14-1]PTY37551.1 hemolysin III [Saccharospirillum sp. MSK14-1]
MSTSALPTYSILEEWANSLTHGIGAVLSIAGLIVLVVLASLYGDAWQIVSASVYGATLILLYSASTLYHAIQAPRVRQLMRRFDHIAILYLIAGTYTPFTLVTLRGPWGWTLFGIVWGLTLLGTVVHLTSLRRFHWLMVGLYLFMGWSVLIAIRPLIATLPPAGLSLLVAGGLSYTLGVVFYGMKRLPFNHAIWHLFVLAGSALHFFTVLYYVIL